MGNVHGMTSMERVLCALEHREPDRVPIDIAVFSHVLCDYSWILGIITILINHYNNERTR